MQPTHAIYILDDWGGGDYKYWSFAYVQNGEFYHFNNDANINAIKILKRVKL